MVTEFCGFGKGVVGKKLPSDTTLNNMKKADLIKLLRLAQHNYESLMWFYNNAVNVNMAQLNNNGWITCSERLPEKAGKYLVTINCGGAVHTSVRRFNPKPKHPKQNEPLFTKHLPLYSGWERRTCGVIAWKDLPAPYQQKEGE